MAAGAHWLPSRWRAWWKDRARAQDDGLAQMATDVYSEVCEIQARSSWWFEVAGALTFERNVKTLIGSKAGCGLGEGAERYTKGR